MCRGLLNATPLRLAVRNMARSGDRAITEGGFVAASAPNTQPTAFAFRIAAMSEVKEIEARVRQLPNDAFAQFREWFHEIENER
jgi:hypothetical protein